MYHVRGRVTREDDPMYDPTNDRIHKLVNTAKDLAESLVRWTKLGRVITSVEEYPSKTKESTTGVHEAVRPSWIYDFERPKLAASVMARR